MSKHPATRQSPAISPEELKTFTFNNCGKIYGFSTDLLPHTKQHHPPSLSIKFPMDGCLSRFGFGKKFADHIISFHFLMPSTARTSVRNSEVMDILADEFSSMQVQIVVLDRRGSLGAYPVVHAHWQGQNHPQ